MTEANAYLYNQPIDLYSTNRALERGSTPSFLSFDLGNEKSRIEVAQKDSDPRALKLAEDGFKSNASYWAKEYIAGIKTTHYYWEVVQQDGQTRLFHPGFGFADDIGKDGLEQQGLPEIEIQRRRIELAVTNQLTLQMPHAQKGDTFYWASPPPEGENTEAYGTYTMTHTFMVDEVDDEYDPGQKKKVLVGRDVRNELSNESHRYLLHKISGKEVFSSTPTSLDILNTLVKPEFGVSQKDLESMIKQQEAREGKVTQDGDEAILDDVLSKNEKYLDGILMILKDHFTDKDMAVRLFQIWAELVKKEYYGTLYEQSGDDMERRLFIEARMMQAVSAGGSCGEGFGFGSQSFGYATNTSAWVGSSKPEDDPNLCRCLGQGAHFHCPGTIKKGPKTKACKAEIMVGRGITQCTQCGESKKC